MKNILKFTLLALSLTGICDANAIAQITKRSNPPRSKVSKPRKKMPSEAIILRKVNAYLKAKKISNKKAWALLEKIEARSNKLSSTDRSILYQTQAKLLRRADYKILSSIYSAKAITSNKDKFSKGLTFSWMNLKDISKSHPIQNFMALLAQNIGLRDDLPPGWDNDWNYIVALSWAKKGRLLEAVREFKKLSPDDRNYFPASYRKAMLLNQYSKNDLAIRELKKFLYPGFLDRAPLKKSEKENLKNLSALALGRIYYEKSEFLKSIYYYRTVEKDSLQYYDALFEQSWALFMNGNPNHALGALYSLSTPFFSDRYNPESSILKAIIYFWICHYDKSKNALADFLEKHQSTIKLIERFANNKSLTPEIAFKVFKARINGQKVSEIPSDVLGYVVDQPTLFAPRDQLAAVLEEKQNLDKNGIFGIKKAKTLSKNLGVWINSLEKEIGSLVIAELKELSVRFADHMKQAKFLYIELLMSEAKQKLGKNLHDSEIKASEDQTYKRLIGWNNNQNMSWATSDKDEVWWDEIGYHIAHVESQCAEK